MSTPRSVQIVRVGPQCLVQDLGRPGRAGEGVTASGAADRRSLRQGNRLVGNDIGAPGLEVLLGGVSLRSDDDLLLAVTGAWCPITVDDRPVPFGTTIALRAGSTLHLGRPEHGVRSYITVRGGFTPNGAFGGSWSTDTSSGIGPSPLQPADRLPIGTWEAGAPEMGAVAPAIRPPGDVTLHLTLGPRPETLDADGLASLAAGVGTISADSNRIGIRINGFRLPVRRHNSSSEAIPLGAVQAPPSGELIVFAADHPTTGGYPVIGVVDTHDVDVLAQCTPGQRVRFRARPAPPL